ncbi:MAG: ParB/RepB/Spo0J family partition protein [Christensenellales bacterium]|jgi:ParB family chromosome partitioning protein
MSAHSKRIDQRLQELRDLQTSPLIDPKNTSARRSESNYIREISRPTNGRGLEERTDLYIKDLIPYARHAFKLRPNAELVELADSIRECGVLEPILVRPHPTEEGKYEIISGHNRAAAMRLIQGDSPEPAMISASIRYVDDATADIMMTEANLLHRQKMMPSELAVAYRMRLDAMKRKSGRPSKNNSSQLGTDYSEGLLQENSSQLGTSFQTGRSDDELAAATGTSKTQIHRYIRLSYLISEFLEMVDGNKIPTNTAVALSYLERDEQAMLLDFMREQGVKPKLKEAEALKRQSVAGGITEAYLDDFFFVQKSEEPKKRKKMLEIDNKRVRERLAIIKPASKDYSDEQIILELDGLLCAFAQRMLGKNKQIESRQNSRHSKNDLERE